MPEWETKMHTFPEYVPRGDAQVAELVRHHPFAAVISTHHDVPVATHVPVITPPPQQPRAGGVLWGHMARANPQWQTFDPARPVLVIFTGAHAYVSAALYERTPAVPTWNYSAVHVTALPHLAGPHPISQKELRAAFKCSSGWSVDSVSPDRV
jgi:transcriptional regulator